jgi:flavin reductase (DIM6/NTAB) family NADH-FMN oxidoreductase RutF
VSWVQQVSFDPPMIMTAIAKGRPITPLILESHAFALCQIAEGDRLSMRKFLAGPDEMPFESLEHHRGRTGSPLLNRALGYLDCTVVRHIDIEGDHDLYIGRIIDGDLFREEPAVIRTREHGFTY